MKRKHEQDFDIDTEGGRIVAVLEGFRELSERQQVFHIGLIKGSVLQMETTTDDRETA